MKRESGVLQFTPTPVFEKFLFDKGANCNRDCPFKVAFGEGQSLRPHNCIGSTPISGVIGVGVNCNLQNFIFRIYQDFFLNYFRKHGILKPVLRFAYKCL